MGDIGGISAPSWPRVRNHKRLPLWVCGESGCDGGLSSQFAPAWSLLIFIYFCFCLLVLGVACVWGVVGWVWERERERERGGVLCHELRD